MLLVGAIVGGSGVRIVMLAIGASGEGLQLTLRLLRGLLVARCRLRWVGWVSGTAAVRLRVVWLVSVAVLHRRWTGSAHLRVRIVRLRWESLSVLIRIPLVLRRLISSYAVSVDRSAGWTWWQLLIVVWLIHELLLSGIGWVVAIRPSVGRLLLLWGHLVRHGRGRGGTGQGRRGCTLRNERRSRAGG